jgi:murein DD-endopeptidase MepM/ murein hydrolase activator NlpD
MLCVMALVAALHLPTHAAAPLPRPPPEAAAPTASHSDVADAHRGAAGRATSADGTADSAGPSGGQHAMQAPPAPPGGAGIPAPGARYAWPLLPVPAIAARFQAPPHPYGRGHRGVDLVGDAGQPVLAARAGTVVFAGPVGARSVVSVDHDDGLRTTYEPVRPSVRAGAVVRAGDVLGLLEPGHPGCAAAVCLHWGVRRGAQEYLDPLVLLRPPEVRLLPVPEPWPAGIMAARGPPSPAVRSAVSPPRAPPACRAGAPPAGCAAGTPATR